MKTRKFGFKNSAHDEQLSKIPQNFASVHDDENKVTELTIYGEIGDSWWYDSTSAADVDNALKNAKGHDVVIHLNSPGGSAFDGIAIYNRLINHKETGGKVTIHVDGWACSAASVIAMAADELIMGLGSMFMIHEASNIVWGNKGDFRAEADLLEELENGIIDIYMTKANVSREEIREKVNAETWFSASSAIEIGFANEAKVDDVEDLENAELKVQIENMKNELSKIKNNQIKEPTQNEPEKPANKRKGFLF